MCAGLTNANITDMQSWLDRYQAHHRDLTWPWIYWAAVPMAVLGTVGLLWSLPVPAEFTAISPLLNWGSAFLMVTVVYYFILSLPIAIGLLPLVTGIAGLMNWLSGSEWSLLRIAGGAMAAGLIGLWLGHRNKPPVRALAETLQTIMIGPVWGLSVIYRRLGIPY